MLPVILDATRIRECILVGHSDGGSIAIIYAGAHSSGSPVKGLVTEAPHVFCEDLTIRSIQKARDSFENGSLRAKLQEYHFDNTDYAFWGWNRTWLHPDFRSWNLEEYLPGIRVPVLVVQGEDDIYGTSAQIDAIAAQAGAGAEVVLLPDCGHSPHREQVERTLEAMRRFVLHTLEG